MRLGAHNLPIMRVLSHFINAIFSYPVMQGISHPQKYEFWYKDFVFKIPDISFHYIPRVERFFIINISLF